MSFSTRALQNLLDEHKVNGYQAQYYLHRIIKLFGNFFFFFFFFNKFAPSNEFPFKTSKQKAIKIHFIITFSRNCFIVYNFDFYHLIQMCFDYKSIYSPVFLHV